MKVTKQLQKLSVKVKKQMRTALLLLCAIVTFAIPAFGDGYSILKDEPVISSASAIEDVDILLVAASAFGEARKAMNATDLDAKDQFINNTSAIVTSSKWQNVGLIVGARDALSGSTWGAYQTPITLSSTEVATYGNPELIDAYNKYKTFGFAVQNLNNNAQKSNNSAVSVEEGLDSMSIASIKLGSFGVKFLNDYNPGPVLLSLYDSSYLYNQTYSENKLLAIVRGNDVLSNIISLFGDKVPGIGVSFFLILNAVIAVIGFGLSMILTLLGNQNIGDGIRRFLIKIVIGTVGIYLVANILSIGIKWVSDTIMTVGESDTSSYVEENLNMYDWYLTGFQLPAGVTLQIDGSGNFLFTPEIVRAINEYTYGRLVGDVSDDAIRIRMENYVQNGNNTGTASFITPSMSSADGADAWATDVYYALMKNYAENKELLDGNDDESSPLYGRSNFTIYMSRYLWMSSLNMNLTETGWNITGNGSDVYYGLNPISAFNLIRSDFSGEAITSTATVYPPLAYVAFDVVNVYNAASPTSTHMNAFVRFIACFTLVLASFKGLVTTISSAFGGLLSGGVKTAFGSSRGLGQAIGAVIALIFGIIGISVIMSSILSLLDVVYGIAMDIVGDVEVLNAFLQPLQDTVGKIPVIGSLLMGLCRSGAELIMSLVLALTFPKLGGIPITTFAQYMADIPGMIAERAQMIEGMLLSGRSSAGGGLPGGRGSNGQYGRMANQMAGKAFANSTRQAAQILKASTMATGALAGASLSAVGKALNKKADQIEGKPKNPGVGNWDEMSPEQQAKAADVAAANDNWNQLDEDTKQRLLDEAGVYSDNNAEGGDTPDMEQGFDDGAMDNAADTGTNDVTEQSLDDDMQNIQSVSEADSLNQPPVSGYTASEQSLGNEGSGTVNNSGMETAVGESDAGDSLNTANIIQNNNQQSDIHATNVDQSKQLNTNEIQKAEGAADMQKDPLSTASAQAAAAAGLQHNGGGKFSTGSSGQKNGSGQFGAAPSATYKSVNAGDNTVANTNAQIQSNTQFNAGADKSNTLNQTTGDSMDSTSASKWGKQMSVKEQKQARALHAIGDSLQMMGGNRTMGEGIRDAVGYATEAAAASVVPPEVMNSFAQDLRNRRQLRSELVRRDRQNKKK